MITTFIIFLSIILFALVDIHYFDKAIDTIGMTAEEWETNSFRFFPGGGMAAAWKYRNGVKNKY